MYLNSLNSTINPHLERAIPSSSLWSLAWHQYLTLFLTLAASSASASPRCASWKTKSHMLPRKRRLCYQCLHLHLLSPAHPLPARLDLKSKKRLLTMAEHLPLPVPNLAHMKMLMGMTTLPHRSPMCQSYWATVMKKKIGWKWSTMKRSLVCVAYCFKDLQTDWSLERLSKEWDAPIYVFFKPMPTVQYIDGRKAHTFECGAKKCHCRNRFVRQFLDKGDAKSMGNLCRHATKCWGEEAVAAANNTWDIKMAREALKNVKGIDGSITSLFQRAAKGQMTYSHHQYTKAEAQ